MKVELEAAIMFVLALALLVSCGYWFLHLEPGYERQQQCVVEGVSQTPQDDKPEGATSCQTVYCYQGEYEEVWNKVSPILRARNSFYVLSHYGRRYIVDEDAQVHTEWRMCVRSVFNRYRTRRGFR